MELCSFTHNVPSPRIHFVFHMTFGTEEIIFTVDYIGTTFDLCFPKLSIVNSISSPAFKNC